MHYTTANDQFTATLPSGAADIFASRPQSGSDVEHALFERLFEGALTAAEAQAVQARLRDDPGFRAAYLKWSNYVSDLTTLLNETSQGEIRVGQRPVKLASHGLAWLVGGILLAIAGATTGYLASGLPHWTKSRPAPFATLDPEIPPTADGLKNQQDRAPDVREVAEPGERPPPETIAIVVAAEGDTGYQVGQRLREGRLSLDEGRLLLIFMGGANLYLDGPAELILQSAEAARLVRGQVAIRDANSSRPFRLNVHDASMVDLGTEFAVKANVDGRSMVRVHEGEISVSLLTPQGTSQISDILTAGRVLAVDPFDEFPLQSGNESDLFCRVPPMHLQRLDFGDGYASAVRESRPLIYWRFDRLEEDGCVPDFGSLGCRGLLINLGPPDTLSLVDGHLQFSDSPSLHRVISERDLPGINSEELTVEIWIRTSVVSWQTLFGLTYPDATGAQASAAVLELAHESHLVHGPMTFRALSRTAPDRAGGTNLLAEDLWMPGAWHHVVMVHSRERLQLFLDGHLVREAVSETGRDESAYRVILGQLQSPVRMRRFPNSRQFVGTLDEFALYDRALTAEEVRRHYEQAVSPRSAPAVRD